MNALLPFKFFFTSMQRLIVVIPIFAALFLNAGDNLKNEEKIIPANYDYKDNEISDSRNKNAHRDLDKTKLTDGATKAPSRIIWSWRSIGKKKPVEITFNFQVPEVLSKVKVHIFRGKKAYGIKRISAYGLLRNGKSIPLGSKTLNQPYRKPKEEPAYSSIEIPFENKDRLVGVTLRVEGISRVSLTEVEFYKKKSSSQIVLSTNPFDYLGKNVSSANGLRIEAKDFNNDGHMDIMLENDYMLYIVEPVYGGVVNYAYDKLAKRNLVKYHDSSAWGGVFCDIIKRDGKNSFDWFKAPYKYKILSRGPENVSLRLWKEGRTGQYAMLGVDKTFTLSRSSTDLKADYRIKLSPDNVVPMKFAFLSFSAFGSNTENWQLFYPETSGVKSCRKGKSPNVWSHVPSQGWCGFVTDSGTGAAIVDEYRRIAAHHFWPCGVNCSVETVFGQFPVDAGSAFKTTLYMVPFYGIGGIPDGVTRYMAAKILSERKYQKAPSELELKLKPSQPGEYSIFIEKKLQPDGKWRKIFTGTRKLSVTPASVKFPFKAEKNGTYVIKASITSGGRNVLTAEHPLTVGTPSGEFVMTSLCERLIPKATAVKKEPDLDFHSREYVTPHIKWAPSYAGGSPSVLFLVQEGGIKFAVREIIELAQRFDMSPRTSYIPLAGNKEIYYRLSDYTFLGAAGYLKHLGKMLSRNKKYDAIVICGNYWKILKASVKRDIVRRVENGMGLVLLYPIGAPRELTAILRIEREKRFKASWKKEKEHFITTGIPFGVLPASNVFDGKAGGEVIASANGKPLISVSKFGKGRIVAASWDGGPLSRSGYKYTYGTKGIMPKLSVLGDGGRKFDYWEYQLGLLAKMIYYAAGKMPSVYGNSMKVSGRNLEIGLVSSANEAIKVQVELTVRDKYYRLESEKIVFPRLSPGKNVIRIPIEKPVLGGIHFADIRIITNGKTQWWGTESFKIVPCASLTNLSYNKKVYKRDENAKLTLKITGAVPKNSILEASAKDSFGRIFAKTSQTARDGGNHIVIPLKDSLGPYMETDVKLIENNGRAISENRVSAMIYTPPDTGRFTIMLGWPESLYRGNLFLAPFFYRMLRDLWGWNSSWAPKILYARESKLIAAQGIPVSVSRLPYLNPGGKHPHKTLPGKGKYGLLRSPCLSNEKFRNQLEQSHAGTTQGEELGAIFRMMPDEANSINKWQGCFSEDCREEFRKWLKKQYGSLENLNREWDANFKSWNNVEAKLDTEITSKKSIAPWLDHRTFNEWNYANAFRIMAEGIRKSGNPSRIMMCGTQETKNYNAYDWFLLTKYVNAFVSYTGEQSVMRRCFLDESFNLPWVGYSKELKYQRRLMLTRMFDDGANGYGLLALPSLNPDWTLHQSGKDLITLKDDFGEGRGELIIRSKYESPPIAFYYSPASIHVDNFYNLYDIYKGDISGAKDALRMAGSDYAYVAYGQIDEHPNVLKKYKIIFLPLSTALSDKEIQAIEFFVKNGGVVVADFLPGGWTRHGRKREKNPMEELFGIESNNPEIKMNSATLHWNGKDNASIEMSTIQTNLKLTSGKALAVIKDNKQTGFPAVIVNKYGRGSAVLLCGDFLSSFGNWKEMKYTQKRKPATEKLMAETQQLLKEAGIKQNSPLLNSKGERISLVSIYRRKLGKIKLIAIIRESTGSLNKKEKAHIVLDRKYYVYKVLFGKPEFLGYTDKPEFETSPSTQILLAAIPYKVTGIEIDSLNNSAAPGQVVEFSVSLKTNPSGEGNKHVVYIKVTDPDGKVRQEYDSVVSLKNGKGSFHIPFALNDKPGVWKIEATDVATNTKISKSFNMD